MQIPDGLPVTQTLDGLEVVLTPPGATDSSIQWASGALCALGGLLIGAQVAGAIGPRAWLYLAPVAGVLLGALLGLTVVTWALLALLAHSRADRTQHVRISSLGITAQTGSRDAEHIPFSAVAEVGVVYDVVVVVRDKPPIIQFGEGQPLEVLQWLSTAFGEGLEAWRAAGSTEAEIPAALQALREKT